MISNAQGNCCEKGLIDISGICEPDNTTEVIKNFPYWKQMYVSETLQIPTVKPDIEQINSIVVSVSIISKKVIKTPRSYDDTGATPVAEPNLEGKLLTGRKLIIEGQLCQQIEYTADEDSQPVHSVHFYVPFSSYIIVPLNVTLDNASGTQAYDTYDLDFDVNACIEDVGACIIDERTILKQVTLLISAVPIQSCNAKFSC